LEVLFTAVKVTLSLAFLVYASWSDYKTREVSNLVWAVYAPLALSLSLAEFLVYNMYRLPFFGLSFGVTALIAIVLFYSGGFGGADSKALMCIALALPFSTETLLQPLVPWGTSPLAQNVFPLTIFSNAVLFAAASCVYLLVYNLAWHKKTGRAIFEGTLNRESAGKKFAALITGHRVPIAKLKEKWHVYPMEDVEDEIGENPPKRKLVIVPRDEGRDEIVARLSKAADSGKIDSHVWATPGLPMLIFVTAGLIVALLFGDVVWILIRAILG
jgi:preflagellin peptidase FlaK